MHRRSDLHQPTSSHHRRAIVPSQRHWRELGLVGWLARRRSLDRRAPCAMIGETSFYLRPSNRPALAAALTTALGFGFAATAPCGFVVVAGRALGCAVVIDDAVGR